MKVIETIQMEMADRKTEPIPHDDYVETENDHLEARCLNCHNAKACKENNWQGCRYEPQTDKHKCRRCLYYDIPSDYYPCSECVDYSNYTGEVEGEPQTEETEMERLERIDNEIEDAWARIRELTDERLKRLQACIGCEHTDMCEWCYTRWSKTEPQTEYDQYREKIRSHDPHKDWFEDEPQTETKWLRKEGEF